MGKVATKPEPANYHCVNLNRNEDKVGVFLHSSLIPAMRPLLARLIPSLRA